MNGLNLSLLQNELAVAGLALLVFFGDLLSKDGGDKKALGYLASAGLLGILIWNLSCPAANGQAFGGMFISDGLARVFKVVFLASASLTALAAVNYLPKAGVRWQGEFYFLLLMVTIGMMLIASAGNLLSLYVALELNTIGFYVLVSMLKGQSLLSAETGLKYLILGALSSAVLLYGISLIYGMSGSISLTEVLAWASKQAPSPLLITAVALILAGLAFKVSLVPFHAWSPDVYQGAPTPVTAFLSTASKAAGFAMICRVLLVTFGSLSSYWISLMMILMVLTFVLGNVVALKQSNIKRLLAYSSIAQAGYLAIGVIAENRPLAAGEAPSHLGIYSLIYYLLVYLFTNMAAFLVAIQVAEDHGSDAVDGFQGLAQRSPSMALVMMSAMFSLSGIPPFGGFFGKFYLFMAGIEAQHFVLVLFAVVMSIVSLYYYLIVVKRMYLEDPLKSSPVAAPISARLGMTVCALMVLAMGVYPAPFLSWIKAALALG
jgi:NADH-quinone oxidoreductase subunit N